MTLRWIEGFETERAVLKLRNKYQPIVGHIPDMWNVGPVFAGEMSGRFHGKAINGCTLKTPPLVSPVANTWTVGMEIRVVNISGDDEVFRFYSGDQNQLTVTLSESGSVYVLKVLRGATLLGTTTVEFNESAWYYLEIQATINTGVAGSVELRMDETVVLTLTGINTANSGVAGADIAEFHAEGAVWIDDIYVLDSAGTSNNDYLGIQTVEGLLPNADGATQEWDKSNVAQDAYTQVNDAASSNDSPDHYVYTDATGEKEYFEFTSLAQLSGDINGVQFNGHAKLDQAGTRDIRYRFRAAGGAESTMAWKETGHRGETTSVFPHVEEQNPQTTAKWTAADINDSQFGVERE